MLRATSYGAGLLLVASAVLCAGAVAAQEDAGTVVSVLGSLQVRAPGADTWERVEVGASIPGQAGIRSGERSAARIVLHDGSAIEMAASSEVGVRNVALVPTEQRYLSLLRLDRGKIHVMVGEQYGVGGSRFEIETPTAVASARNGHFIISYEEKRESTAVTGLEGDVGVQGTIGLIGPGVTVGPRMFTQVQRGRFPAPAAAVDGEDMKARQAGLSILGTGDPAEGIGHGHPASMGRVLRPEDLPARVAGDTGVAQSTAGVRAPRRPGETFADRLSPDIRAHTQPIPEFRVAPPGERPAGAVQVDF